MVTACSLVMRWASTAWVWPNPLEDVAVSDLRAAQAAVAQGGPWRERSQEKDLIGQPIGGNRPPPAGKSGPVRGS
jgi:hypothetical protein